MSRIHGLVADLEKEGIPAERIAIGGFSQGPRGGMDGAPGKRPQSLQITGIYLKRPNLGKHPKRPQHPKHDVARSYV